MIASIVFGSFGIVATLSGMQCSKIGGENYLLKGRIAAIGGVFFLLQGNGAGLGQRRANMFLEYLGKESLSVTLNSSRGGSGVLEFVESTLQSKQRPQQPLLAPSVWRCRVLQASAPWSPCLGMQPTSRSSSSTSFIPGQSKSAQIRRHTLPSTAGSRVTALQVWDRRGPVHRLVFSHAGHLWRVVPGVCLQAHDTPGKNVGIAEVSAFTDPATGSQRSNLTSCVLDHIHINRHLEDACWRPHRHRSPCPATTGETLMSDSHVHAHNGLLLQMEYERAAVTMKHTIVD